MTLELKKTSRWWYARIMTNGRRKLLRLPVEIEGERPESLRGLGDRVFEQSRARAQIEHDRLLDDLKIKGNTERHLQQLYEAKAERKIEELPLDGIFEVWKNAPHAKKRSKPYEDQIERYCNDLICYVREKHRSAKGVMEVTDMITRGYLEALKKRKVSSRTHNDRLLKLRGVFEALKREGLIYKNPFDGLYTVGEETIHREPYTPEELRLIVDAAEDVVRGPIITAVCTAMRQGDCCTLKWTDVDLQEGFVTVKTGKTGETAEIPIFPLLRGALEQADRRTKYVWPEAAKMYRENRHGIGWRVGKALRTAGAGKMRERENGGKRKVSVKDFHSFRTTWITMALTAGIPMELVTRVTGHATVDVVLKHYFRPGREEFRKVLSEKLPDMLTGGSGKSVLEQVLEIAEAMTGKTWKSDRYRILSLVNRS